MERATETHLDGAIEGGDEPADGVAAVVFDLDGVLVDTLPVMQQAFEAAFREVVGPGDPPFDAFRELLGLGLPEILSLLGLPRAMETAFVRESARLAGLATVCEGIPTVLRLLAWVGVPMGIATGKSGRRARELLALTGLAPFFEAVVGFDEVARPKPAGDHVAAVLRLLRAPTEQALVIGDAVVDIESGRAAGAFVAAALWGQGESGALRASGPDFTLAHPRELLDLCLW